MYIQGRPCSAFLFFPLCKKNLHAIILPSTQTKGIGSNVATDSFLAQFDGMDGTQNITLGQGYDAYSGATISSKALFAAINDCINCYNELA